MNLDALDGDSEEKRWQPLSSVQRRVAGVLVEKAKTTPDSYPLTLNALTNGCNQKSNRLPNMDLSPDEVEQAIEELRSMGAAAEVQAGGRAPKYRHYLYEWLGADKVELAVMAELLLRGEQTLGELRGRASRMEPIPDLNALHPVIDSLTKKQLILALTHSGRGQIVTHNLYPPEQLEQLKQRYSSGRPASERSTFAAIAPASTVTPSELEQLRTEIADLRNEVAELRQKLHQFTGDA